MSLRSNANLVRNATQVDPPENDEDRIGGLFQDIADVAETVDTIADLRAFDTTILTEGDVVEIRAHNTTGLNKGFGGGKFVWITTEVLTINETVGAGGDDGAFATLATNEAVAGDGRPFVTNKFYGDNLEFTNGALATVISNQASDPTSEIRSYGIGSTSVRMSIDSAVPSGTKAYFADDNGVYIRPSNGEDGYFRRILPEDGAVTYAMYGAVPQKSFRDDSPFDSYQAMQDAEDSLFDVKVGSGYYYTTQTVKHTRNKNTHFTGASGHNAISPDGSGRYIKYVESDIKAYIYADTDIDIYQIEAPGDISINVECRAIPTHTKRAVRVFGDEAVRGEHIVKVNGEIDSYLDGATDNTNGTRAYEIDLLENAELPDTFSTVGFLTFSRIKVSAVDCYSGITSTLQGSTGSFINSNHFTLTGRRIVKPVDLKGNMTYSTVDGWYQEVAGIPRSFDQDIPVVFMDTSEGVHIDFMTFDPDANTHLELLDIDAPETDQYLGRMSLGSRTMSRAMRSLITSRSFKFFDLPTRLALDRPLDAADFNTVKKRLQRTVTASEVQNSNTTPIELYPGSGDVRGLIVEKAYIKPLDANSSLYSTNTVMKLQANAGAAVYSHDAGTINLDDSNLTGFYTINIPISAPDLVHSGGTDSNILRLFTEGGDPTGGDCGFTIYVEFEVLANDWDDEADTDVGF